MNTLKRWFCNAFGFLPSKITRDNPGYITASFTYGNTGSVEDGTAITDELSTGSIRQKDQTEPAILSSDPVQAPAPDSSPAHVSPATDWKYFHDDLTLQALITDPQVLRLSNVDSKHDFMALSDEDRPMGGIYRTNGDSNLYGSLIATTPAKGVYGKSVKVGRLFGHDKKPFIVITKDTIVADLERESEIHIGRFSDLLTAFKVAASCYKNFKAMPPRPPEDDSRMYSSDGNHLGL